MAGGGCARASRPAGRFVTGREVFLARAGVGTQVEDFEKFRASARTNYAFPKVIDASTVEHNQGPALVSRALRFSTPITNLQWQGPDTAGAFGSQVITVVGGPSPRAMVIDFVAPVDAAGLELKPSGPQRLTVEAFVRGRDRPVADHSIHIEYRPVFVGFVGNLPIVRLKVLQPVMPPTFALYSIDDVTFRLVKTSPRRRSSVGDSTK